MYRKLDKLGRIVIPKEYRKHLGIAEGDLIEMHVDGTKIIVQKTLPLDGSERVKEILRKHGIDASRSLVEELGSVL